MLLLLILILGMGQLQANETQLDEAEFEQLYAAPAGVVALLSVFYGGISILAVIGNSLVIWVVATTRQMRTVTNMYIANLAFADVVIGIFCIPFQFQAALLQRWNLPYFMCGFCPFVQAVSVNVSVFTLTAIAIDRHRAIINPLRARPTKFISKFIILIIWLVAFTFAIPCAIAFRVEVMHERIRENDIVFNVTRPFCENKNLSDDQLLSYRYSLVFVQYLVPFCVISFVYIQMAVKLWGTRAPGNAQDSRDITLLKNKKKVIKMLIIVVVVFGVCWLPLQLYNVLYVTIPEINEYRFINIVFFFCDWLAMSNSCYNPFIYGIYNEKFKREFNKRFSTCFCKFRTSNQMHERTISMHTRASSIRSSYGNSSMRVRHKMLVTQPYSQRTATTTKKHDNNSIYNIIKFSSDKSKGKANNICNVNALGGVLKCPNSKEFSMFSTRKSNWRPTQPNLFECDDDLLNSTFSTHSEEPSSTGLNKTTIIEQELEQPLNCVCEQALGKSNSCDGTCILNEVSRVQVPGTGNRPNNFNCLQQPKETMVSNNNYCPSVMSCTLQEFYGIPDDDEVANNNSDDKLLKLEHKKHNSNDNDTKTSVDNENVNENEMPMINADESTMQHDVDDNVEQADDEYADADADDEHEDDDDEAGIAANADENAIVDGFQVHSKAEHAAEEEKKYPNDDEEDCELINEKALLSCHSINTSNTNSQSNCNKANGNALVI